MILKNTKFGLTIILCAVFGILVGFAFEATITGLIIGVVIGIPFGNILN